MKTKSIILFFILLSTYAYSQENIGFFGGLNYSYFTDGVANRIGGDEKSFGIHLGVLYEIEISEKISFRPKLFYSQQGDREKSNIRFYDEGLELSNQDLKLDYLNILFEYII